MLIKLILSTVVPYYYCTGTWWLRIVSQYILHPVTCILYNEFVHLYTTLVRPLQKCYLKTMQLNCLIFDSYNKHYCLNYEDIAQWTISYWLVTLSQSQLHLTKQTGALCFWGNPLICITLIAGLYPTSAMGCHAFYNTIGNLTHVVDYQNF